MIDWQAKKFQDLTNDELYQLLALRQQIFMLEQNILELDADTKDFAALHIMGQIKSQLIAYARILFTADKVYFGRVLVEQAYRGQGIAKQLVQQILYYINQNNLAKHPIEISAQAHLIHFYETFNFVAQGEVYLVGDMPHIYMRKENKTE